MKETSIIVFLVVAVNLAGSVATGHTVFPELVRYSGNGFRLPKLKIPDRSSWVGDNLDKLANKTLREITLPGTHDSGAYYLTRQIMMDGGAPGSLGKIIKAAESIGLPIEWIITPWALSQDRDFYEQMVAGVRYFDLRAGWNGTYWCTFHMEVGTPVQTLLSDVVRFLDDHPHEIVIVETSHLDGGPTAPDVTDLMKMLNNTFGDYLLPPSTGFATIGEMVSSGHRALVTVDGDPISFTNFPSLWYNDTIINSYADSDSLATMVAYNNQKIAEYTKFGCPDTNLFKISWTLTTQVNVILLGLLPGFPHSLIEMANTAVPALGEFLQAAIAAKQRPGNVLIVDHFEQTQRIQLIDSVIAMNTQY